MSTQLQALRPGPIIEKRIGGPGWINRKKSQMKYLKIFEEFSSGFDAGRVAAALTAATGGWGTDEEALAKAVLSINNRPQLQEVNAILAANPEKYEYPSVEATVKGELGFFDRKEIDEIESHLKSLGSAPLEPSPLPSPTARSGEAILVGGLDTRAGDKSIDEQVKLLEAGLKQKVQGFRYTADPEDVISAVKPGQAVFLFSAGCKMAAAIAKSGKTDPKRIYIIEPWTVNGTGFIEAAVSAGVPRENVFAGPSASTGSNVNGSTTVPRASHWDALTQVGKRVAGSAQPGQ